MTYFVMALMFVLQSTACSGGDKVIEMKDLPASAQSLVKDHFHGKQVLLVQKDIEGLRTSYDVVLNDGAKLEFDAKGKWIEIDCKPQNVPDALIPTIINDYVKQNFSEVRVVQIERDRHGYEIDLSNGLEIRFNKHFKVVKIDD